MTWRAHLEHRIEWRGLSLTLCKDTPDGRLSALVDMTFRDDFIEGDFIDPVRIEDPSLIQAIVDAAWSIGIKPQGFSGDGSELKATHRHLEDMRSIAFHKVGAEKP